MVDYSLKNENTIYSKYSGRYVETKDQDSGDTFSNGSLDFDGYLKLLVAQMSNQDFNDPMSDADLLNQMAQYSMLEGIKDMTQQSAISYAASLVGKVVTVSDGQYYHTGVVSSISVENGKPSVIVDGESFKSSEITDIVNMDEYNELKELIGKTVTYKGNAADAEDAVKGVVTGIVFLGGQGYVAVNGNTYPANVLQVVDTEEGEEGGEGGTEGVEGSGDSDEDGSSEAGETGGVTGGTESSESNTEGTENNSDNAFKVGEVGESKAASYAASSEALADLLMKELDRVDEVNSASAASEQSFENFDLEEIMQTAHINVPEFSAGVYSETERLISSVDNKTVYANGDSTASGVGNVSLRDYDRSTGTGTLVDDNYSEVIRDDTATVSTTSYNYDTTASRYTASGKLRGVTAAAGIATSDGVPHRISVEQYPEEAALADELGTRMYDIKFIHNHEVTSRIKSGPVIARTASGRGVTEIGYSGVGQLGEVVTFEDGTQRVEILLKSGKSTWLYTSGKYTLDQICTRNGVPGSLSDMTGAEKAIRYYSHANGYASGAGLFNAPV